MIINNKEYTLGMFRGNNGSNMVTHLYEGSFAEPGNPMCSRGWQRKYFDEDGKLEDWEYSIFRNNVSDAGICKICLRRAEQELPSLSKPSSNCKESKNLYKLLTQ